MGSIERRRTVRIREVASDRAEDLRERALELLAGAGVLGVPIRDDGAELRDHVHATAARGEQLWRDLVVPRARLGVPRVCLYLQRRYTTLRLKLPPQESRDRFKALVVIQETFYDFELTAAFTRAIRDTETAVTAHYALPPTAPIPAAAGPS